MYSSAGWVHQRQPSPARTYKKRNSILLVYFCLCGRLGGLTRKLPNRQKLDRFLTRLRPGTPDKSGPALAREVISAQFFATNDLCNLSINSIDPICPGVSPLGLGLTCNPGGEGCCHDLSLKPSSGGTSTNAPLARARMLRHGQRKPAAPGCHHEGTHRCCILI